MKRVVSESRRWVQERQGSGLGNSPTGKRVGTAWDADPPIRCGTACNARKNPRRKLPKCFGTTSMRSQSCSETSFVLVRVTVPAVPPSCTFTAERECRPPTHDLAPDRDRRSSLNVLESQHVAPSGWGRKRRGFGGRAPVRRHGSKRDIKQGRPAAYSAGRHTSSQSNAGEGCFHDTFDPRRYSTERQPTCAQPGRSLGPNSPQRISMSVTG